MQSRHGTLSAGVVTTVSLLHPNADQIMVHIRKGSTGPIFFTVDGTTPTVNGNNTLVVKSVGDQARLVRIRTAGTENIEVKLISATADGYSVEVF